MEWEIGEWVGQTGYRRQVRGGTERESNERDILIGVGTFQG